MRVIDDLTEQMTQHASLAVGTLISIVKDDTDRSLQFKAAESQFDRVYGRAMSAPS